MTAFGARCPHCDTLFKVYPDQLRLHNGFANCGACGQTFDVQAVLLYLPQHDTDFLEHKSHLSDGLPVLNAVAQVKTNENNPPSPSASNVQTFASKPDTPIPNLKLTPAPPPIALPTDADTVVPVRVHSDDTNHDESTHPPESESGMLKPVRVVPKKVSENLATNTKLPSLSFIPPPQDLNNPSSKPKVKKPAKQSSVSNKPTPEQPRPISPKDKPNSGAGIKWLVYLLVFALIAGIYWLLSKPKLKPYKPLPGAILHINGIGHSLSSAVVAKTIVLNKMSIMNNQSLFKLDEQ